MVLWSQIWGSFDLPPPDDAEIPEIPDFPSSFAIGVNTTTSIKLRAEEKKVQTSGFGGSSAMKG